MDGISIYLIRDYYTIYRMIMCTPRAHRLNQRRFQPIRHHKRTGLIVWFIRDDQNMMLRNLKLDFLICNNRQPLLIGNEL